VPSSIFSDLTLEPIDAMAAAVTRWRSTEPKKSADAERLERAISEFRIKRCCGDQQLLDQLIKDVVWASKIFGASISAGTVEGKNLQHQAQRLVDAWRDCRPRPRAVEPQKMALFNKGRLDVAAEIYAAIGYSFRCAPDALFDCVVLDRVWGKGRIWGFIRELSRPEFPIVRTSVGERNFLEIANGVFVWLEVKPLVTAGGRTLIKTKKK